MEWDQHWTTHSVTLARWWCVANIEWRQWGEGVETTVRKESLEHAQLPVIRCWQWLQQSKPNWYWLHRQNASRFVVWTTFIALNVQHASMEWSNIHCSVWWMCLVTRLLSSRAMNDASSSNKLSSIHRHQSEIIFSCVTPPCLWNWRVKGAPSESPSKAPYNANLVI